jgi:polyphosphate kinase
VSGPAPAIKERIVGEILSAMLADNQRAWILRPDGRYERVQPGTAAPLFSQEQLMALARRSAISDVSRPASVETLLGSQGRARRRKRS